MSWFASPVVRRTLLMALWLLLGTSPAAAGLVTVDFEDLSLAPDSYWNGSDGSANFVSRGAVFNNDYNTEFGSWSGWAYSNKRDKTTGDWNNQYAAYTGEGHDKSANYGVAYASDYSPKPTIALPEQTRIESIRVTNTTYAALSMLLGDSYGFSKKFGGLTGNDPDYFLLTITGLRAGSAIGSIDFYLADYRFTENLQDYVVDTWELVDLSSLDQATHLEFSLKSSDNNPEFGMNTPAYFAVDDIVLSEVPEPAACILFGSGMLLIGAVAYRRRSVLGSGRS